MKIAGVIGETAQAVSEAGIARALGYDAVLVSLGGMDSLDERALLSHCRNVADTMPIIGFYLQPAVGGRVLSYRFWRDLAEVPQLIAVKIAPFDRYRTLDVVRAIVAAGRSWVWIADQVAKKGNGHLLSLPNVWVQRRRHAGR